MLAPDLVATLPTPDRLVNSANELFRGEIWCFQRTSDRRCRRRGAGSQLSNKIKYLLTLTISYAKIYLRRDGTYPLPPRCLDEF